MKDKFGRKTISTVLSFFMMLTMCISFFPNTVRAGEGDNVIPEIWIESDTTSVVTGILPKFSVSTKTEHVKIEDYGSNTTWSQRLETETLWRGFGGAEPVAYNDGKTHYAMRFCVTTDSGYAISSDTKVYFNGVEQKLDVIIEPTVWGAYIKIDLGFASGNNPEIFTVSFFTDGGLDIDSQKILVGRKVIEPSTPGKPGYRFIDWYEDSSCTIKYDFDKPVLSDITLYAKWYELPIIPEIWIESDTTSVVTGILPKFSVSTKTEHVKIEDYGSNTTWLQRLETETLWRGFGGTEPIAYNDGKTHYAMRFCVTTDSSYAISSDTKVYFNGVEQKLDVIIEPTVWGAYIKIDLGLAKNYITGKAGDNATWKLDLDTGEVIISGTGAVYGYSNPEMFTQNVEDYQNLIKSVVYEDGITTTGNSIFSYCANITSVTLPESMKTIEGGTFAATKFSSITIPKSVTKIEEYAFMGSAPLSVDYRGSKADWEKISISSTENKRLLNATITYHDYLPVSSVSVTGYVAPSEGATPVKPNVPDGVNYKVVRSWYEVPKVGNTKDAKLVTGNFEAGKIYCLTLDFTVSGEYEFTPDVKAYVDGKEVEIVKISDNKIRVLIYTELKPKNGIEGFCERLYTCALGRASDPAGVKAWADALRAGADGAKVARGFFFSDEFINKKLDNTEYVTRLYKTFMDREPDAAGLAAWVKALDEGASREKVFNGFINSVEWANICFKYGIKSGGTAAPTIRLEPSAEILAFAERLYTTCLGRAADPSGLKAWADALANREGSGAKVAHGFFFSEEFINKKFDNGEFVRRCYLTFMGREPDAGGYAAWVKALNDGATREQVFNGFVKSPEFVAICEKAGIIAY